MMGLWGNVKFSPKAPLIPRLSGLGLTRPLIASSKRSPQVLSVSIVRCFKSLIWSASILVKNTFLLAIIGIIHLYRKL